MTEPGIGSDLAVDGARRAGRDNGTTSSTARRRSSPTASTPTSSSPRSRPTRSSAHAGHLARDRRARHGGLRARAQPREDRHARAGHRRAVLQRRRASRSRTCSARRARASATSSRNLAQERLSIAIAGVGGARRALDADARVRQGAQGVRPADRLLPEHAASRWPRCARRSSSRRVYVDQAVAARSTPASSRRRTRRWPSGGAPSCRAASSTAACSCTAATAT